MLNTNAVEAKGEYNKAAKFVEEKLLTRINEIHSLLMTLLDISIKDTIFCTKYSKVVILLITTAQIHFGFICKGSLNSLHALPIISYMNEKI